MSLLDRQTPEEAAQEVPADAKQSVVAVCDTLKQAKQAIHEARERGFPSDKLSLVTRSLEDDEELHAYVNHGDLSPVGGGIGGALGGLFGALIGAAFFWIPGIGPLVILGPLATGMTGAIVGALVGAMSGWGIPADHVPEYEKLVKEGKVLVIAHGNPQEVAIAADVWNKSDYATTHVHAETSDDSPEIDDWPKDNRPR